MRTKFPGEKITSSTWRNWLGQWAELLQSGMPVLDALSLSSELQNGHSQGRSLRLGLSQVSRFLHEGQSLQTAFRAAFGKVPMHLEIALVCAQANGDLGVALRTQIDRWTITSEAQKALGRSLIYPAVVLAMACACWLLLHHVSAPHLTPTATKPAVNLMGADVLLLIGTTLLTVAAYLKYRKSRGEAEIQPLLPNNLWLSSSFYHVIACELQAGLDLMYCLRHRNLPAATSWAFHHWSASTLLGLNTLMHSIQQHLKIGMPLSQAMTAAGAPHFLTRQSQLAEQTGNLAYCFFLTAKVYEIRARETQARLQSILPSVALAVAALTLALAYQFTLAPLYDNLSGLS